MTSVRLPFPSLYWKVTVRAGAILLSVTLVMCVPVQAKASDRFAASAIFVSWLLPLYVNVVAYPFRSFSVVSCPDGEKVAVFCPPRTKVQVLSPFCTSVAVTRGAVGVYI